MGVTGIPVSFQDTDILVNGNPRLKPGALFRVPFRNMKCCQKGKT